MLHRKCSAVAFSDGLARLPSVLKLDGDLLEALFVEKFGDVVRIPSESWAHPGGGSGGPHRSMLWRWRRGKGVPKEYYFIGIAASLDVDPCLLLRLPEGSTFLEFCEAVSKRWWGGSWPHPLKKFAFLQQFILGQREWPPTGKIAETFKRDWHRVQFSHVASTRANYYAAFLIEPRNGTKNRVWHFAWRDRWRPWRPYGVVIARDSEIHLYCFDGREATVSVKTDECDRFIVETWFGPNNAEFCLASLHEFSAELYEGDGELLPSVRFSVDHADDSRAK
jgi:hypothetical protein